MLNLAASSASLASLPTTGWIVQKFGGTSVGKFPETICDEIVGPHLESSKVVIVCSARSAKTKSEGTTNRLLTAADLASDADDEDDDGEMFQKTLDLVEEDHVANAKKRVHNPYIQERLIKDTKNEIHEIRRLLEACCVIGEIPDKTNDIVMACGEKLSCLFMAALLEDRGIAAKYVDLSEIVTSFADQLSLGRDEEDREVSGLKPQFYTRLSRAIADQIYDIPQGVVPVLTGFFGPVPGGLLNSVGRGYTDLCAALCAVGLNADELQIWKEVDGIFTADPRKVKNARLLSSVTPEEAAELTYYGSEVIHPFTMEQVIKAKIPIRIKNVMNPEGSGTVIYPDNIGKKGEETPPHPPISAERLPNSFFNKAKTATAITAKPNIAVLSIHSNKKTLSHGFLANVFKILNKHKLVVDLISTSEVHVSMAMNYSKERRRNLMTAIDQLKKYGECDVTTGLAIVSLVGIHMKQLIGIAGAMFKTLADEKINIEMISQGSNEINISCVIDDKNVIKALNALHDNLILKPIQTATAILDQRISELRLG
ncbi:DEKNAAC103103 [Brettanomyces naardenensis]|uniref:Aspartokinase n=1 Tax=Brettanomyces naardenensis TaxID=13370 RepID=A0A448YMA3_BRENA|nr:DEKNAAC103103 [Brettanomyces naardenensis]